MTHVKAKALASMRRIARARTLSEFEKKVGLLKDDEELWGQSLFKKWFEKTWLRQHKASTPFYKRFSQRMDHDITTWNTRELML